MSDFTQLAERYIDSWNETDPSKRRALLERLRRPSDRASTKLREVHNV